MSPIGCTHTVFSSLGWNWSATLTRMPASSHQSPPAYGNALLLLDEGCYFALTGPGYDAAAFHVAKRSSTELNEGDCGRVYVQGLSKKSHRGIALLFDKVPTPGGDHCHFPQRLWAPLGR